MIDVPDPVRTLGVIGAGQMGGGIAHVAALAGIDVVLLDADPAALQRARSTMARNLDRQVRRGAVEQSARDAALARITGATAHEALAPCQMVIEAATEREAVKRAIFEAVCPHLGPDCVLATNTSSLPITRLAAATDRPDRFLGMHFMNPVPVMKLVEVIRGIATGEPAFQAVLALAGRMGKESAVSEDFPGFIVNRILLPMLNEAMFALFEGVGSIAAIDRSLQIGLNHPMGPFELADFIGLDTCLSVTQVLHAGFGDDKYRPCPLLVKYVEAGWLGRKTGRGFYDYSHTPPRPTR